MTFNGAPKGWTDNTQPKNDLNRLHDEALASNNSSGLLSLINHIRDPFHQEWHEANKDRLGGYAELTPAQTKERAQYVDGVDASRIETRIDESIATVEEDLQNQDENEEAKAEARTLIESLKLLRTKLSAT